MRSILALQNAEIAVPFGIQIKRNGNLAVDRHVAGVGGRSTLDPTRPTPHPHF